MSDVELYEMTVEVSQHLREQAARGVRAAVVLDFSHAGPIAPHQRKIIGEWRKDVRELTRAVCVGMAMVVKTPLIRGVLTAIAWFSPEPVPVVYLSSLEDAIDSSIKSCEAAGLSVPPDVVRRLKGIGWMREPALEPTADGAHGPVAKRGHTQTIR